MFTVLGTPSEDVWPVSDFVIFLCELCCARVLHGATWPAACRDKSTVVRQRVGLIQACSQAITTEHGTCTRTNILDTHHQAPRLHLHVQCALTT